MRRAFILVLALSSTVARADTSADVSSAADVARTLVELAHNACDFMAALGPRPPGASERRIATRFGRILKSGHDGDSSLYLLAVQRLPGWKVEYQARKFRLYPPDSQRLPVRELVGLLGKLHIAELEDPPAVRNDFAFTLPAQWGKCYFDIDTELVGDAKQRIITADDLDRDEVNRRRIIAVYFGQPGAT
jgi:hypothetical protein